MNRMAKRPAVTLEKRLNWLKRSQQGESPPKIAEADSFDVRTVRKHIDRARRDQEVEEARSHVLRNALEAHYAELSTLAESLDAQIAKGSTLYLVERDALLYAALRQHIPRSPIWPALNKWDELHRSIAETKAVATEHLRQDIKSNKHVAPLLSYNREDQFVSDLAQPLLFQLEAWARGNPGLTLRTDLYFETSTEEYAFARYSSFHLGRVKIEDKDILYRVLDDCESHIKERKEYSILEKLLEDIERVRQKLRGELAIIRLRRVVPGRCKFCPL